MELVKALKSAIFPKMLAVDGETVIINGQKFKGQDFQYDSGRFYVDGKDVTDKVKNKNGFGS